MRILLSLILLLTLVPIVELTIILQVHHLIASTWNSGTALLITIGMIAATGIAGAALARQQGFRVLGELQQRMGHGELPGRELMDGVLILVGAALLLTPGFLTDLIGFSLLIPFSRALYRQQLSRWAQGKVQRGDVQVVYRTTRADVQPDHDRLEEH